jgi:tetratricopeptide (TPR) repeat protein
MKRTIKTVGLILLLIAGQIAYGQTNKAKALEIGNQAIKLEDDGEYEKAIKLFETAQRIDPDKVDYPYEIAYCYFQLKEYEKVINIAEKLTDYKDAEDVVYELLGNAYDNLGKADKAIDIYESGLKKFPKSGRLYLEMGVMQMGKKNNIKELAFYEKGIEVAPKFPSNYYRAAKIYCSSTEKVWGMIYGEIFMNLERNSKRTVEISKLLFNTYKNGIKFTGENSVSVSFSKNSILSANDLKEQGKIKLPFGVGVYEPTIIISLLSQKSIDINSLDTIRSNFVNNYFTKGYDKTYPNLLFSYQKKVKEAGYIEAYNHWILMKGDEDGFDKWLSTNKDKWESFTKWFRENGLKINDNNKFYKGQY